MGPKYKKFYKKDHSTDIGGCVYLIIVESPSKCSKIESFLGQNYKCIASKGHLRELRGLKNIDVKNNYKPTFSIIKEKSKHISWMNEIIEQFPKGNVIVATDDDREGEGIAWHICEIFNLPISTTKRIIFHEITKQAILNAVQNPSKIDMKLVQAQQARQILDIIVGFKISPHLWKHIFSSKTNALSAGRCQTPALRLIYDNQIEQDSNELQKKYKTTGFFSERNIEFILGHEFENEDSVTEFLKKTPSHDHMLSISESKQVKKSPPKPLNTSKLLQIANNTLHTSPGQTMSICQKLYQNGYITYMRTESTKYAPPFLDTVNEYITNEYGNKYIGNLELIKNKDKNNPHEAIRVTNINRKTISSTNSREVTMYKMIYKNTLESCMSDAVYLNTQIKITAPSMSINKKSKTLFYTHTLEMPIFLGWKIVISPIMDQTNELGLKTYFETIQKAPIKYNNINCNVVARNTTSYYSESSLIKKLEDLGIGRPSTFATIVDTIQERGYVKCTDIVGKTHICNEYSLKWKSILDIHKIEKQFGNEKSKLQLQQLGLLCIEFLIKYFDSMFSYDYTSLMEDNLDKIANNVDDEWYKVCDDCTNEIKTLSKSLTKIPKEHFQLDDNHELMFTQYGTSIKKTNEDGTISYLKTNTNEIDINKVRNKEYMLKDLVKEDSGLGKYKGFDLKVNEGKYGYYLQYGTNKVSLKEWDKSIEDLDYNSAVKIIEDKNGNKSILRVLNSEITIRSGKYGPYVYFKSPNMIKPQFFPLKKCPHSYETCDIDTLVKWITDTYIEKEFEI